MNRYSWHTSKEKDDGGWYKCNTVVVFPGNTVKFNTYPFYKPNRKGGHRHNQWKNAIARMRKCHICGAPIVKGFEVSDEVHEFQCRACRIEQVLEDASNAGVMFGHDI